MVGRVSLSGGTVVLFGALFGLALVVFAARAFAQDNDSWRAALENHAGVPPRVVAVDKEQQRLFVFEQGSGLHLKDEFVCTTGQVAGDKHTSGDLRTPEGVYFVVQHLNSGLDHVLYGNEAYTLNYPNPADKARGKTGYGIWIHGRGEAITPLETHGCVALNNDDLTRLGPALEPGTAVVLTESFTRTKEPSKADASAVEALTRRVQAWARAWGQRSASMFDFYDADAYTRAQGEPFAGFRAQKERLFKSLAWIRNTVRDIHVLQGPGYWVTWFYQDYSAPNLSTKGVRRLYWSRDAKGEYRILGMEWTPGMVSGSLAAGAEAAVPPVEAHPVSEDQIPANVQAGMDACPVDGKPALAAAKTPAPAATPERTGQTEPPSSGKPAAVAKVESPSPDAKSGQPAPVAASGQPAADAAVENPVPVVKVAKPAIPQDPRKELEELIEAWRLAWEKGDLNAYMDFYAENAVQGDRTGSRDIKQQKRGLWSRHKPVAVRLFDIQITIKGDAASAQMRQEYQSTDTRDAGIKTLYFQKSDEVWRIIREEWSKAQ